MTYELACWLAAKLDIFDLKVRGGKTKKGRENNDLYYSSGWAHGYKQAQTDARRASRGPRLPKAEPPPTASETSAEQASYLKTRDCEHDWKESTTKGWENCMNCGATRVIEKAKRTALNRSAKP